MNQSLKIVGLGGSLSGDSTNLAALKIALLAAEHEGANIQCFDVSQLNLPMFDRGITEIPKEAKKMVEAVHQADALIWASPLYHGTISGIFKNAIDWLELLSSYEPKYITNTPVGLIATAGGVQGMQAINTMEYIVRALRGYTVPMVAPISKAWEVFNKEGKILDTAVENQLANLGKEVLSAAKRFQ